MVALVCCYLFLLGYETAYPKAAEDVSPTSRTLLSSGGEIIPGFNGDCSDQASWEGDSGAVVHVILVVYLFLGIAIICDEQFTSSLESICDSRTGLGLSPDVAGATFMAAGSSAPELASSFMGTFISNSDVGLGTIIGSAVFNILIIIGATAIVVGEPMQLDWRPLGRDVMFYCGSVILLISFVAGDQKIEWWEAMLLLVYYAGYITFMVFNTGIMRWVSKQVGDTKEKPKSRRPSFSTGMWHKDDKDPAANEPPRYETPADGAAADGAGSADAPASGSGNGAPSVDHDGMTCVDMGSFSHVGQGMGSGGAGEGEAVDLPGTPTMGSSAAVAPAPDEAAAAPAAAPSAPEEPEKEKGGGDDEEEEGGVADMVCEVLSIPFVLIFDWTMPDCKYEPPDDDGADERIAELEGDSSAEATSEIDYLNKCKELRGQLEEAEEAEDDAKTAAVSKELFALYDTREPLNWQQKAYLFTFTVSLIHITWLSYFMVVLMEKIGCAWGISSFIMGITFLAMGTSVPDALGSIAVAKEGEGDMAVSNAIGSNVFDICIGLGLPWLLATLYDGHGRKINAATESIVASTVILFLVVVVLFLSLWSAKHPQSGDRFCLFPFVGYILFACYGAFVIFQLIWVGAGLPE